MTRARERRSQRIMLKINRHEVHTSDRRRKRTEVSALDRLRRRMIDFKDMNPGKLAPAPCAAIKSCSKDHDLRCTTSNCGPYRGIDRCCAQCYHIGPHPGQCKFES